MRSAARISTMSVAFIMQLELAIVLVGVDLLWKAELTTSPSLPSTPSPTRQAYYHLLAPAVTTLVYSCRKSKQHSSHSHWHLYVSC